MIRPFALLLLTFAPAFAEDTWPADVAVIVDAAKSLCKGGFTAGSDAVTRRDLNGDGTRAGLILHDWDTLTEGGTTYLTAPNDQGQTVRFLWSGTKWQLQ
jgi:hypothetical protein